jgi:hypothetical protein
MIFACWLPGQYGQVLVTFDDEFLAMQFAVRNGGLKVFPHAVNF